MSAPQWPSKVQIIDQILTIAEPHARASSAEHPEDVAIALITAIEVAWRAVKPVRA